LAEGKTQNEIARIRHVELSTIRTHIGNILKKFNEPTAKDVVKKLKSLGVFEIFLPEG
jgi:DNA-binding CsgD family transcriptional regulator